MRLMWLQQLFKAVTRFCCCTCRSSRFGSSHMESAFVFCTVLCLVPYEFTKEMKTLYTVCPV